MSTRNERVDADRRLERIWWLGSLTLDLHRVHRIAAKMSPLCFVPTRTRAFYTAYMAHEQPLSDVKIFGACPYTATKADLLTCWRADPKRIN